MNYLKTTVLSTALCVCLLHASAQNHNVTVKEPDYNKPELFKDLPRQMKLQLTDLQSIIDLPVGSIVKTQIADHFIFQGTIVSKADDPKVKSVVVKSINRVGATLTFTKTLQANGTFSYVGRIISFKHADAYEIVQENGQYLLQKTGFNDLVSE